MGDQSAGHRWKFVRVGGVDQVVIRSGADIANLDKLDQKNWVALACPTKLVEFDNRTLELLDLDKDGRIRAPEIMAVSAWVRDVYKNPDELMKGSDSVSLASLNTATPAGANLHTTAKRLLQEMGKADAQSLTLEEITEAAKSFAQRKMNGDGVLPPDSAPAAPQNQLLAEIVSTLGGVPDRSGKAGVDQAKLDAFFAEAAALVAWHDQVDAAILPIAAETPVAANCLQNVRAKVDDFFTRGRLAEFDVRASAVLNQSEAEFKAMSPKDLTVDSPDILRLPLAQTGPGAALPLEKGINPGWRAAIGKFRTNAVEKLLGARLELKEAEWVEVQARLAPYLAWIGSKPAANVEKLGLTRLREILASGLHKELSGVLQKDLAENISFDQIVALEKLARVQRDLYRLLNNFVSFSDFYGRRSAIFQAGTLYLDARSCDLTVHVADPAKHAALAGLARTYLAYCDCTRLGEKMTIAAAFTAGDSDHLMVGRNGVFYDRKGRDWDATITKIIDNPISLGQAFWSPYKKFVRLIEEQVAKRAAAADTAAQAKLGTTATHIANLEPPKPGAPAPDKKMDVGTVAALGVALGSLGTFLGLIFTKFIDLGWWIPLAMIGLVLAISGPAVLIAWLKLRQRNLGPILDANGWAVNGRMKVNVPFGGALSKRATIPPGSELQLTDPFVESHVGRNRAIAVLLLLLLAAILWKAGLLAGILP